MKKLLLTLLTLALCLLTAAACADTAWQVGDTADGFTVTDVRAFDSIGADLVTLTHDKTGATVLLVLNDDTNRVFQLGFHTVAENNEGVPHVFEHATLLSGSEKYPSGDLYFNLSYQTYNTYMNASTYSFMTLFPVASLSEEQLLKYADYYTDCCFNPLVMTDESVFRQEAWRCQVNEDGTLSVSGTVYNEMLGSYTLDTAATFNACIASFPGSTSGNVFGGKPSDIPKMTWQELKDYHDKYYHPSNCLAIVYGKLEQPEAFLSLLDGYFSEYEARDYSDAFTDSGYTPLTESAEVVCDYAVESGTSTENASKIVYSFVCTGAGEQDHQVANLLTTLLNADSSPLQVAVKEQLPHATVRAAMQNSGPELLIMFSATGVNEEDAAVLKQIVDDALAQVAENGFDSDLAESVAAAYSLSTRLDLESSELGIDLLPSFAAGWAAEGDLYYLPGVYDALDSIVTWNTDGTYQNLLKRFTGENALTTLVTTRPVPGLKEQEEARMADQLAELQATLTDEQLENLTMEKNTTVASTTDMVAELTAVTVDSLPEEIRTYEINDASGEDGVRRIHVKANADGVGYSVTRLNLGGLDDEQLLWCQLYVSLLSDVDTASHTSAQLGDLVNRYLGNANVGITTAEEDNEYGYTPYLNIGYYALDGNLMSAAQLMHEVLFESDFTQTDVISGLVSASRTQLKKSINSAGYSVMIYRMFGSADPGYAMYVHINFMDYYDFLGRVQEMLETDPASVTAGLNSVVDYLQRTGGAAIVSYVGSDAGCELNNAAADTFLSGLGTEPVVRASCDLSAPAASEALVIDSNSAFNMYFVSWEELGLEGYSADWDALCSLLDDRYLLPVLREENGAYGAYSGANDEGIYIYTYRDPCVTESFDTMFSLGSLLREDTGITQELLNGYILSAYSSLAMSSGELYGGRMALSRLLNGRPQDEELQDMRKLKSIRVENISSYADVLDRFRSTGRIATASSASTVTENASLYESVLDPFGMLSAATATDLDSGDSELSWCVENGLLSANGEGATLGDLACAFMAGMGSACDADTAIATLSQYGILPAADASTPLTRENLVTYVCCLLETAAGYDFPDADLPACADADQVTTGLESLWAWCLDYNVISQTSDGLFAPQSPADRAALTHALYVLFAE